MGTEYKNYECMKERIITTILNLERGDVTLIAIYVPEERKYDEYKTFHEQLTTAINRYNKTDQVILIGDFNYSFENMPKVYQK